MGMLRQGATVSAERCSKDVPTAGMRMHYHQCFRTAVVKRAGRLYCKLHDPVEADKKQRARQLKWDEEWKRKQSIYIRERKKAQVEARLIKLIHRAPKPEHVGPASINEYCTWYEHVQKALDVLSKLGRRRGE